MPFLDFLPGIGNLVEGGLNLIGQTQNNIHQDDMMRQQRAWAVEDWNKQNAYNAPAAQMQRFKDAGLNPNLIYGQGNSGNAAPIRSTDTARTQPVQSNGIIQSMLTGFLSMYNLQKTQAETDRLAKQAQLLEAERRLKEQATKNMGFQLFRDQSTLPLSLEGMNLKNRNLAADLPIKDTIKTNMVQENARKWLSLGNSLQETAQRILESQARTSNLGLEQGLIHQKIEMLKKDNTLKDLEISLKNKGFTWSDPAYIRMGSRIIDQYLNTDMFKSKAGQSVEVGNSKAKWHFRNKEE